MKRLSSMTCTEALEERIKRLEKLLHEMYQMSEVNIERANQNYDVIEKKFAEIDEIVRQPDAKVYRPCLYYIPGTDTSGNCVNCGRAKYQHP